MRARQNEIADKVLSGEYDPKRAAIAVQSLNGVLACLNAMASDDLDRRIAEIETRLAGKRSPKGGDA